MEKERHIFVPSLLSGGAAGFAVDITLFPLDALKTRLQSSIGFKAAGGFRNIYNGLGPAALGSAPNAAVFFCVYEMTKEMLERFNAHYQFINHAAAASVGELAACIIRVPTEVVKQRRQISSCLSSFLILRNCFHEGISGLYRGYWSTVAREIPFSFIQYPLWEFFKKCWVLRRKDEITSWQSALSGSLAGGIAAAITTPLDVAKTRIMLAPSGTEEAKGKIWFNIKQVYIQKGIRGLYAGVIPRSLWMCLGGAIYFGVYEFVRITLSSTELSSLQKIL